MSLYIDDNLEQGDDGTVECRHCGHPVGVAESPLRDARVTHSEPGAAGPSIRENSETFTDRPITLRRTFCPHCLTLLQAEIVPADEPSARRRSLAVRA
jgi:hypothetical protein